MVRGVFKCGDCRRSHQKCIPANRRWEPNGGIQEKCCACVRGDRPCSAPERVQRKQTNKTQQVQHTSNMTSVGPDGVETRGIEGDHLDSLTEDQANPRCRSKQDLDQLLREIDIEKQVLEEVDVRVESTAAQRTPPNLDNAYQVSNTHQLLLKILDDTKGTIQIKLGKLELLAEQFAQKGDTDTAERAYLRALQAHGSPVFKASTTHWKLLQKVAKFYFDNGNTIQGEKYLEQILELPDIPEHIRRDTLQNLAQSMKISSLDINTIFLSKVAGHSLSTTMNPLPPLHRMMRLESMSKAPVDLDKLDLAVDMDIMGLQPLHSAVVNQKAMAVEMIGNCVDFELERRDKWGRTPLFLSALFTFEAAGKALLDRFATLNPQIRKMRMADRDYLGWSILAVAILSGCSLHFIQLLVENGGEVNPYTMRTVDTPIQSAARNGRLDVVDYLLHCGARLDDVAEPEDLTATQLALAGGHHDIFRVLQIHSDPLL